MFTLPFLLVEFPPATDLPQHLAQVRLFFRALAHADGPLVVQWANPNNLIYFIMGTGWPLFSPVLLGKLTLWLLVAAWIAGIHLLARRLGRPPEQAMWASVFVMSHAFYWGFLNFLVGFPVFVLWFLLNDSDRGPARLKTVGLYVLTTFLLYESHALWLGVAVAWLFLFGVTRRTEGAVWIRRAAGLIPITALASFWFPRLAASRAFAGFDVAAHWFTSPLQRLRPDRLVDGFLGGIRGPWEAAILALLFLWCGLGIVQHRKELRPHISRPLLLTAGLFLAVGLLAPDKYMNTICFASRWLPVAGVFLVLSLPAPTLKPVPARIVALALTGCFCLATTAAWKGFNARELDGLSAALGKVPDKASVLGLDFEKTSAYVKNRPFLQIFAYAQALKGGEVNFSFAEHASGIVAYRSPQPRSWTPSLEWFAERARKSDIAKFDLVLLNGPPDIHQEFAQRNSVSCRTCSGRWRLYAVEKR
ncbi:MAG TPA: hypothetical protein VLN41_01905 [Candidatus Bathyarchaeia archaeon]|nr:hypothetical protein [Candidatus Bathyarchaeia archaeon]